MKLGKMYNKNSRTDKQSCCNISELELKLFFDRTGEEGGELLFCVAVFKQDAIDGGRDRQVNAELFAEPEHRLAGHHALGELLEFLALDVHLAEASVMAPR